MRIGVMCSGNGTNFENIVRSCREDEVVLMIYNKRNCGAKKRATKLGIPNVCIKSADEDEIIKLFKTYEVDLIVLAGWMRVISSKFVNAFPRRIINLHPSLLPKFKGLDAVQQALDSGEDETGCTVHYVNEELDGGEIIDQLKVPILPEDTVETLTPRIQRAEYSLLPTVIDNLAEQIL